MGKVYIHERKIQGSINAGSQQDPTVLLFTALFAYINRKKTIGH